MEEKKMMKEVTEYTCSFCYGVTSYNKQKVTRHEKKCASRPFQLTPYEWGSELDDRAIGEHAEELLRTAVRVVGKANFSINRDLELDYPYYRPNSTWSPNSTWNSRDYLDVRARDISDVMKVLKSPDFMKEVEKRATEMKEKAIKLVAGFAKEAKMEVPKELEEKSDVPKDEELD